MSNKKLFLNTVKNTLNVLKKENADNINDAVKIAKKAVHTNFKGKRRLNISIPRDIPLPKIGGFLPLILVLAALSAVGGLVKAAAFLAQFFHTSLGSYISVKELNYCRIVYDRSIGL